ncbi:MAG: class I SAM-dependent methyltransferase [Cyanobacteria bacterium P01_D01_bin.156]
MTERYTDYNNWAWLYNKTVGPDYSKPQLALLERVLLPHIPKQGKILDLCCGTGQLIQPLIEAGYDVVGLDGSEEMLAYARQNAPQADFLLEDARTFDLEASIDGVFSTSASLNHLMSLPELTQVFERVYRALKPDGIFVFDLNHPEQLERWWQGQPTEGEISRYFAWMITPRYDSNSAEGAFEVTIYQSSVKSSGLIRQLLFPIKRMLYTLLSRPRFIGLRLRVLQNFAGFEPHWEQKKLSYPVKGHEINAVITALQQVGFKDISLQTIDGSSKIDDRHSAHFICQKSSSTCLNTTAETVSVMDSP